MKAKELTEKDNKSLLKLLADTQTKLLKDRFAIAGKELNKVTEIASSRKLIAQIKTVMREKEIFEAEKLTTATKPKAADVQGEK
ncbi:MAG: 50S ribosomal protein L29 [bacterium]